MRLIHGFDPNVPDDHGVSQYITLYCCGITVPTIKYIAEPTAQMRQRFAPGISRYGLAPVMEYLTNVIDPMTMIRVIMGPKMASISMISAANNCSRRSREVSTRMRVVALSRSNEHKYELQSLMRI